MACTRPAFSSLTRTLTSVPPRRMDSEETCASVSETPAPTSAPTTPPVAAPATAPTAVAASQPAATTGPRPGMAIEPKPARRPAPPPRAPPTPAPVVGAETSWTLSYFSLTYLLATRLTSLVGMPLASTAGTASRASAYVSYTRLTVVMTGSFGDGLRRGLENDVALVVDVDLGGLAVQVSRTAPHAVGVLGDRSYVG